jgi:hypothetical protein
MVAGAPDGAPVDVAAARSGNFVRNPHLRGQRVDALRSACGSLAGTRGAVAGVTRPRLGGVPRWDDSGGRGRGRTRWHDRCPRPEPNLRYAGRRARRLAARPCRGRRALSASCAGALPRSRPLLDPRTMPPVRGRNAVRDSGTDRVRGDRPVRRRLQRWHRHCSLAAECPSDRDSAGWLGGTAFESARECLLAHASRAPPLVRDPRVLRRRCSQRR